MSCLVAIIGPTATGKSSLALRLAQEFDGEIVNADSRQVYRHMDIGTAKPDRHEVSLVRHHLIDIINPDEDFSLARYQELAFRAIDEINGRKKLPLLVGGSGLYVWAALEGWDIPRVAPDPDFRQTLEDRAASGETDELYQELLKIDPVAAEKIDRHNVRRLIRALEVSKKSKIPFSRLQHKKRPSFESLIIGLTTERTELYRRIDSRVDRMIEQGLVEEVRSLVDMGYGLSLPAMSSIGYRQIGAYLNGDLTLEAAISKIKTETHRLVRRQYNWFRLTDKRIKWFDITDDFEAAVSERVKSFLSN